MSDPNRGDYKTQRQRAEEDREPSKTVGAIRNGQKIFLNKEEARLLREHQAAVEERLQSEVRS